MNLSQSLWYSRPRNERRRLALAGGIILLLLGWLLGRQLSVWQQDVDRWEALARQSEQLLFSAPMQMKDWHQLSRQSGLVLQEVQPVGEGWQIKGQQGQMNNVQAFLQQVNAHGWFAREWQLNTLSDGIEFEFLLQAVNETERRP